jgi:hypothetical protein
VRGVAMLGVGLIALSACSTVLPGAAPLDAVAEVSACAHVTKDRCTLPNGGRPLQHVAFPDIKDWSSLKISLRRTMCDFDFDCPVYTVTVRGDGAVSWHGEAFVKTKGRAIAQIAPEKVRALFEAFRKVEFFWLFDEYTAIDVAAGPSNHFLTIAFDAHTKTVRNYAGEDIGMPQAVYELERAIDETANTAQWIGPDAVVEVSACAHAREWDPCTLPNGGRPFQHVAFPDIKNWSSLRISFERTQCFGDCPIYKVTVAGDGTVSWHGEAFVKTKGSAVAQIAPEKVRGLFEAFRKAEFFWLFDRYIATGIADVPYHITTIAFDGHTKTVTEYAGEEMGMPEVVHELEWAIDEAANTAQWIGPPDDPARQLQQ